MKVPDKRVVKDRELRETLDGLLVLLEWQARLVRSALSLLPTLSSRPCGNKPSQGRFDDSSGAKPKT